jgi:hypothetical protein|tara:strand:+ start:98 stop:262 length:165 start_codon:yes stop_codon:yes gene_type:complete
MLQSDYCEYFDEGSGVDNDNYPIARLPLDFEMSLAVVGQRELRFDLDRYQCCFN